VVPEAGSLGDPPRHPETGLCIWGGTATRPADAATAGEWVRGVIPVHRGHRIRVTFNSPGQRERVAQVLQRAPGLDIADAPPGGASGAPLCLSFGWCSTAISRAPHQVALLLVRQKPQLRFIMLQYAELFALITEAKWCSNSSAQRLFAYTKKIIFCPISQTVGPQNA